MNTDKAEYMSFKPDGAILLNVSHKVMEKNTSVVNARSVDSFKCQIDPTEYDLSAESMRCTTLLFFVDRLFQLVSSLILQILVPF